ncbi:MAG: polysaccharide deacetylase family protein [Nanoarchaeota archaeon]|nr:polysaccharide deacetylase family protein [Nanoarchaeota archaeon]
MEKTILLTIIVTTLFFLPFPSNTFLLLTFDTELDLPPILNSSLGVSELNVLLDFLEEENVKATFFTTSQVSELFPEIVSRIVSDGHELAAHSVNHSNVSARNYSDLLSELSSNILTLSSFNTSVTSFRPPYNQGNPELSLVFEKLGLTVDGSHKGDFPFFEGDVLFLTSSPLFYPSSVYPVSWVSVFRESLKIQKSKRVKVVVVGLHPWELVDLPVVKGFEEYTIPAGNYSWSNLRDLVSYAKSLGVNFVTASEFYKLFINS